LAIIDRIARQGMIDIFAVLIKYFGFDSIIKIVDTLAKQKSQKATLNR
jgi:hypothetical protein